MQSDASYNCCLGEGPSLLVGKHKAFIEKFYTASKIAQSLQGQAGISVEDLHLLNLPVDQVNTVSDVLTWTHLKMNAVYWASLSLYIINCGEMFPSKEITQFVMACYHTTGGFSPNIGHDPHILSTLSAIQILLLYDSIHLLNVDQTAQYIKGLQLVDGSFQGDEWGEIDTRFSYAALSSLSLIHRLDVIDVDAAISFVRACQNYDGGFGVVPGTESHAGQVFCCLGALSIAATVRPDCQDNLVPLQDKGAGKGSLNERLKFWLSQRQLASSGGLNGRPDKLEDVCYSWWALSSLYILQRVSWISREKLVAFILNCQNEHEGGFSDRAGDMSDIFHTCFGLAGLALLGYPDLKHISIDPVYCMPKCIVDKHVAFHH